MSNIANFPILYQYERGNKVPIDLHGSFLTMDAALTYLRAYKDINVYAGLLISIGTGEDVKLYIVKSNTSGEYRLEETGGSVKKVANKNEIDAFATADNIGKQFYLTSDITSGSGDSLKVDYAIGLYVVTGASAYQKLATASASGDLAGDVTKLEGRVGTLEIAVGDSSKGLTKEVNSLKTAVGDSNSGLVKQVATLLTNYNTLNNSAVKDVKVTTATGTASIVSSGVATVDLSSYATLQNLNEKISSVFVYKGTKSAYTNLPASGNVKGDVWNVEAGFTLNNKFYPAGTNVAWNGSAWDPLGGEIDLSNYFNKTEVQNAIDTTIGNTSYLKGFTVSGLEHDASVGGDHLVFEAGSNLSISLNDAGDGIKLDVAESLTNHVPYLMKTLLPSNVGGTATLTDEDYTALSQLRPTLGVVNYGGGLFSCGLLSVTERSSSLKVVYTGTDNRNLKFDVNTSTKAITCISVDTVVILGSNTDSTHIMSLYGVKNSIGALSELKTTDKTSTVQAINELVETLDWEEVN